MKKKLTWEEIKDLYSDQWVELVDYDWPDSEPLPSSGTVRVHSSSRKEFDKLINQDPPTDAALVYVGERKPVDGVILSANLHPVNQ